VDNELPKNLAEAIGLHSHARQLHMATGAVLNGAADNVFAIVATLAAAKDPRVAAVLPRLYWDEAMNPTSLARAAGLPTAGLRKMVGSRPSGFPCDRCGGDIPRSSRSWRPDDDGPNWCRDCIQDEKEAEAVRRREEFLRARRERDEQRAAGRGHSPLRSQPAERPAPSWVRFPASAERYVRPQPDRRATTVAFSDSDGSRAGESR
jgi:hypothetical protein